MFRIIALLVELAHSSRKFPDKGMFSKTDNVTRYYSRVACEYRSQNSSGSLALDDTIQPGNTLRTTPVYRHPDCLLRYLFGVKLAYYDGSTP